MANVSLMVARGDVEDQVLVAGLLELGDGVVQLGEVRAADAQDDACCRGDLAHGGEVVLVGAVQDGLVVLDGLDSRLGGVDVLGVDDDGAVRHEPLPFCRARRTVALSPASCTNTHSTHLTLADALVVDLLDALDARVDRSVVHVR